MKLRAAKSGILKDTRAAVSTEYVAIVGTVSLLFVFALVAVGPILVNSYSATRNIVMSPFP